MSKTRTDLVKRALEVIGVLAAGQNPEAEDVTVIDDNVEAILEELAADEIVYVPDIEDIDDAVFMALAVCVAGRMQDDFGAQLLPGRVEAAEAKLRRIGSNTAKYTPQVVSYF